MHVKSYNNIYLHKLHIFSYFTCIRKVTHRNSATGGVCVCIQKNLNSLKLMKAEVQTHYYLQIIREN